MRVDAVHDGGAGPSLAAGVPLWRLYTLRVCYFILAAGIGVYFWPSVIHHTAEFAVTSRQC